MTIVVNEFEEMQKVSGKSVNTAAIQRAKTQLDKVASSILDIESNTKRSTGSQRRYNDEIRNGTNAAVGLAGKIKELWLCMPGHKVSKVC